MPTTFSGMHSGYLLKKTSVSGAFTGELNPVTSSSGVFSGILAPVTSSSGPFSGTTKAARGATTSCIPVSLPATEGQSLGSSPLSVSAGLVQYVGTLKARRGLEGPQIVLTHGLPTSSDVDEIRIIRRLLDYPRNESDGDVLFSGTPAVGTLSDIAVEAGNCVYYATWAHITSLDQWVSHPVARVEIIPLSTGFLERRLIDLMPDLFISGDKFVDEDGRGVFKYAHHTADDGTITEAPLDSEQFNFQDGDTDRNLGPLRRMLKTYSLPMEEVRGLLLALFNQLNPEEACASQLTHIAEGLGFTLNRDLPVARQRSEILGRVELYRKKGTADSLRGFVSAVTGFDSEIRNVCTTVLRHPGPQSMKAYGSILAEDGSAAILAETGEKLLQDNLTLSTDKTPSVGSDPKTWGIAPGSSLGTAGVEILVYFPDCATGCLSEDTVAKLFRELDVALPVCAAASILFVDDKCEETLTDLSETLLDVEFPTSRPALLIEDISGRILTEAGDLIIQEIDDTHRILMEGGDLILAENTNGIEAE